MGKTEFLTQDLTPAAEEIGYSVGYCNLWQEDQEPTQAIADAVAACAAPRRVLAKVRARLKTSVSTMKVSGKLGIVASGAAELVFNKEAGKQVVKLRSAFSAFDRSKNKGLLLIDEAQVLADKKHNSLERALRALLDTRKDQLKVIFTGSSEDRLRTMFGAEDKPFYNWARVEPLPLLGEEFVDELTQRANALATMKLEVDETLRAFETLKRVPELFRRFLSQYLANPFEGVNRAIETCKQSVYLEEGFASRWNKMLPADRVVLQFVADGESDLHGVRALARMGRILKLGISVNKSVPQNALKRLRDRQILIQSEVGVYRFEDEAFKDWIQAERSGTKRTRRR